MKKTFTLIIRMMDIKWNQKMKKKIFNQYFQNKWLIITIDWMILLYKRIKVLKIFFHQTLSSNLAKVSLFNWMTKKKSKYSMIKLNYRLRTISHAAIVIIRLSILKTLTKKSKKKTKKIQNIKIWVLQINRLWWILDLFPNSSLRRLISSNKECN